MAAGRHAPLPERALSHAIVDASLAAFAFGCVFAELWVMSLGGTELTRPSGRSWLDPAFAGGLPGRRLRDDAAAKAMRERCRRPEYARLAENPLLLTLMIHVLQTLEAGRVLSRTSLYDLAIRQARDASRRVSVACVSEEHCKNKM